MVNPSQGVVPAFGSFEVQLHVKPDTPGHLQLQLPCWVEHGNPEQLLLLVKADVAAAVAVPDQVDLDFGLMRWGTKAELELSLSNAAESCAAAWEVEQVPGMEGEQGAGDLLQQVLQQQQSSQELQQQGGKQQHEEQQEEQQQQREEMEQALVQDRLVLGIGTRSGEAPPAGSSTIKIACSADKPGSHSLLLRVKSGGGCNYVRVLVTVVVPDVVLSKCR
jgi:hypothetical protein